MQTKSKGQQKQMRYSSASTRPNKNTGVAMTVNAILPMEKQENNKIEEKHKECRAPLFPCNSKKRRSKEKSSKLNRRGKQKTSKSKSEKERKKKRLPGVMQPPNAVLAHETKTNPQCARYPNSFKHAGHDLNIMLE